MTTESKTPEELETETAAPEAVAPGTEEEKTPEVVAPAEEEIIQLPANQLQQFIEQQAETKAQLLAAQAEAQALREAQATADTASAQEAEQLENAKVLSLHIQAKEGEYSEYLIAGDKDKASAVYAELSEARATQTRELLRTELAAQQAGLEETIGQQLAGERLKTSIQTLVTKHPELNTESPEYNPDLTTKINDLTSVYVKAGVPGDKALAQSVELHAHLLKEPAAPGIKVEDISRKTLKEKLSDASRQPGTPPGKGSNNEDGGSTVVDLTTLIDAEFAKLSPAVLAAMRGDTLT